MPAQRNQQNQDGGQKSDHQRQSAHRATDEISFYDKSLKKQIEGSYVSDGKSIHVSSAHGVKSAPYGQLGACIDHDSQVSLAQKLLSELARDAGGGPKVDQESQEPGNKSAGSDRVVGGT